MYMKKNDVIAMALICIGGIGIGMGLAIKMSKKYGGSR